MKQLEVQIMGQAYLLGCPDGGESRLLEAVEKVDTAMCKIRDGGKVRARDRIAVLAALNLAFDLADKSPSAASAPVHAASFDTGGNPAQDLPTPHDRMLLASLLERLDVALGTDGRLL